MTVRRSVFLNILVTFPDLAADVLKRSPETVQFSDLGIEHAQMISSMVYLLLDRSGSSVLVISLIADSYEMRASLPSEDSAVAVRGL